MSYPITYKGVTVTVGSLDEAAELIRKLTADDDGSSARAPKRREVDAPGDGKERLTPKNMAALWKQLASWEREILVALAKADHDLGTDELATSTGVATEKLKYSVKRIHSRAKKLLHIDGTLLIRSTPDFRRRPVKSVYAMSPEAKQAIIGMLKEQGQ